MSKLTDSESGKMTPEQLAEAAGRAWSNNDKEAFLSLFNSDAVIYHPMFPQPVSPEEVADVVDKGGYKLAHTKPEGDGIFMVFDQVGTDGKISSVGAIPILGKIKNNKFSEFRVGAFATHDKSEPLREETIKRAEAMVVGARTSG